MLKNVLAVACGLIVVASSADAAVRSPLVEYFTNVQCPPCYSFDATLIAWEDAHDTECSIIHYHMSWPGYDPFYATNTLDNNARRAAYGVNAIPELRIDVGEPASLTGPSMTGRLNAAISVPCYTELALAGGTYGHNPDSGFTAGEVAISVTTETEYAAVDARLFVAIVEMEVVWNGYQTYDLHDYVLRKFISGYTGLPIDIAADDASTYTFNYQLQQPVVGPTLKAEDFIVVAWIQNGTNGAIEQSMMVPFTDMAVVSAEETVAAVTAGVGHAHPNPFNPTTSIPIVMDEAAIASVQIFDATGSLVRTLSEGSFPVGTTNLRWDGTTNAGIDAPSGVYFVRLQTDSFTDSRAITLLK